MIDREKIIKGLECCKWSRQNINPEKVMCNECPYKDKTIMNAYTVWQSCTNILAGEALALLKEQEQKQEPKPMIEIEDDDLYAWSPEDANYYCPECEKGIFRNYHFCPYCGQAVKLDG